MSFAQELADKDRDLDLVHRHVNWGPRAANMSADDRARVILSAQWQIERGHSPMVENLDRWTPGDEWRAWVSRWWRFADWVRGIRDPYSF